MGKHLDYKTQQALLIIFFFLSSFNSLCIVIKGKFLNLSVWAFSHLVKVLVSCFWTISWSFPKNQPLALLVLAKVKVNFFLLSSRESWPELIRTLLYVVYFPLRTNFAKFCWVRSRSFFFFLVIMPPNTAHDWSRIIKQGFFHKWNISLEPKLNCSFYQLHSWTYLFFYNTVRVFISEKPVCKIVLKIFICFTNSILWDFRCEPSTIWPLFGRSFSTWKRSSSGIQLTLLLTPWLQTQACSKIWKFFHALSLSLTWTYSNL